MRRTLAFLLLLNAACELQPQLSTDEARDIGRDVDQSRTVAVVDDTRKIDVGPGGKVGIDEDTLIWVLVVTTTGPICGLYVLWKLGQSIIRRKNGTAHKPHSGHR